MKTFLQPLQNLAEMEEIQKQAKKNRGILEISGCMESQKAHLMYGLSGLFPCHLVIAADENLRKNCMKIIVFMINVFITIRQRIFFFSGRYTWESADSSANAGDSRSSGTRG